MQNIWIVRVTRKLHVDTKMIILQLNASYPLFVEDFYLGQRDCCCRSVNKFIYDAFECDVTVHCNS